MSNATATATTDGDVLLTFTDDRGAAKQMRVELSVASAEELKAQIDAALVMASVRASQRMGGLL